MELSTLTLQEDLLSLLQANQTQLFIDQMKNQEGFISIDYIFPDGMTMLLHACQFSSIEVVQFLLEQGANINFVTERGLTPLGIATLASRMNIVKYLITCGVETSIPEQALSPLVIAARNGDVQIFLFLFTMGCDLKVTGSFGSPLLQEAIYGANFSIIDFILEHGVNIHEVNQLGHTALCIAVDKNLLPVAELLLERGANPNVRDVFGFVPLMEAAKFGRVEMVQLLLRFGANPYIRNEDDKTSIDISRIYGWTNVEGILLRSHHTIQSIQ